MKTIKDIIWCLKHSGLKESNPINPHVTTTLKDAIAWLEKQKHDGKKWIYEDVYLKEKEQLIQDGIDEVLENPQKYGLKKQGEQKPFDYENANIQWMDFAPKSAMEAIKEEKVDNANKIEPKDYSSIDPHFGKPVDKVEPKFKVGDWVINRTDATVMQIINNKDFYESVEQNGQRRTDTYNYIEWDFRLWTIQDAKDGDVLSDGTTIFIFKDLLSDGSVMSYCDYDTDSGESDAFCHLSMNLICSKITPATKELRDLLFQKMKEAGYEWDADKKELKKVEQKPATWSKEDEMFVHGLIRGLAAMRNIHGHTTFSSDYIDITETIDWLKSLKDRVQPKIEWDEEDEQIALSIEQVMNCASLLNIVPEKVDKIRTWLKSLRP